MAPVHKIALIQLNPKPLDCEANFNKAAEFIRDAAAKGAHLAVLPEYHLTNWLPEDPKFAPACSNWKHYLSKYQDLARELSICIVPGTIVELHENYGAEAEDITLGDNLDGESSAAATPNPGSGSGSGRRNPSPQPPPALTPPVTTPLPFELANVAYFISHTGEILNRYQKKNLWHPERPHLTGGLDDHEVFDTPLGRVGMLVCWDLAFPEAFRELIGQGAQIIIIPTFWTLNDCSPFGLKLNPRAEALFLQATMVARAFENTCAVIFVNAGESPTTKNPGNYAGLSQLAIPFVGAVGDETKDTAKEGMSVVELDMQVLEEAEKQYKVREDIRRENWHYVYRHAASSSASKEDKEGKSKM